MPVARTFTFGSYSYDTVRGTVSFEYHVEFADGKRTTFLDRLDMPDVPSTAWGQVPEPILTASLEALLLVLGINYWCVFPTSDIRIEGFALNKEQAAFWNSLYLNGLAEFFYDMQMDFDGLISFPYDKHIRPPAAQKFPRPHRALLLNGAGKDSALSAELLKAAGEPFDFFSFSPTPAHARVAKLAGARTIGVSRRRDPQLMRTMRRYRISSAYPSVSTFTFIAVLLSQLLGYDRIIFSNERSADSGNLVYRGLPVNHQWCKSSAAEREANDYIQTFITAELSCTSLLRRYSELDIVRRFVQFPRYLRVVTSCNTYFWLPRALQLISRSPYWCRECPKCAFLFACYAAFLPKADVMRIFRADLYADPKLLPLFKSILGIEGFKPLDCVGEPEEMILAMRYAAQRGEYAGEPALTMFAENFPAQYDFSALEAKVFTSD